MEPRHIQPSNLPSQILLDHPALSRARQPLSHAAGNAQQIKHPLASVGLHDDTKVIQLWMDTPNFVVTSQPSRKSPANALEFRRQSTRRQKNLRFTHNPIQNSPQYRAYRERQQRDGNAEDQKWPDVLEDAFLNALLFIPKMGRRKFSYRSKPHGRNELIKEYLWMAYVQSLAPGQRPDESFIRTRKQVSSHIQVLKGFMKDHPDYERLFPRKAPPNNGSEDSFKNDPCLRALTEGRIYTGESSSRNQMIVQSHGLMKPSVFWLLITSRSVPDHESGRYISKEDLYRNGAVAHEYTMLGSQKPPNSLESISNWREKFPFLEGIYSNNELSCDLIHVDVSLHLMQGYARHGAELVTRMEMSIPGRDFARHQWQTVTTLVKPGDLYHKDPNFDPPLQQKVFHAEVLNVNDHDTRVKVPFPANGWAHAFTCLTNIQMAYDESSKAIEGSSHNSRTPAREYLNQISMYQEVHSSPGPGVHFQRRAVILWTFHKARGENGSATWRYLDPLPPRRICMSPSPHPSHQIAATMSDNLNSWADPPMHPQTHILMDPFVQGLATPPTTAGLQSPYHGRGYNHQYDMPQENLSFMSSATIDSEDTLVANETTVNIDRFFANTTVNLNEFDQHPNSWHIPQTESFDTDPAWAYNVPASTLQIWDGDAKNHTWHDRSPTKQVPWIEDANGKHDEGWNDVITSPMKQDQHYIETSIEQRLLPWIDYQNGEAVKIGFPDTNVPDMADAQMKNGAGVTEKHEEHAWSNKDFFDGIDYK